MPPSKRKVVAKLNGAHAAHVQRARAAAADAASSNAEPEPDVLLRVDDGASACAPWQSHDPSSARLASLLPLMCFAPVPLRVVRTHLSLHCDQMSTWAPLPPPPCPRQPKVRLSIDKSDASSIGLAQARFRERLEGSIRRPIHPRGRLGSQL